MKITVNTNTSNFLQPGNHNATITSVDYGRSSKKGTQYVRCLFETEYGFLFHKFWLNNPMNDFTKSFLIKAGCTVRDGDDLELDELVGRKIRINVKEREWTDIHTGEIKTVLAVNSFSRSKSNTGYRYSINDNYLRYSKIG